MLRFAFRPILRPILASSSVLRPVTTVAASDLSRGDTINRNGKIFVIIKSQLSSQGRQHSFLQIEMKEISTGQKYNEKYRPSEKVEKLRIERVPHQFLYRQGKELFFMNNSTFEQKVLPVAMVEDRVEYLSEGMVMDLSLDEKDEPILIHLPEKMEVLVTEADLNVKGLSATASLKNAVLENGRKVYVPSFIESGQRIIINLADESYVSRAN